MVGIVLLVVVFTVVAAAAGLFLVKLSGIVK
jgi:hypothetical protein